MAILATLIVMLMSFHQHHTLGLNGGIKSYSARQQKAIRFLINYLLCTFQSNQIQSISAHIIAQFQSLVASEWSIVQSFAAIANATTLQSDKMSFVLNRLTG
jgi:hypothetical protein